jgi:hypothetical protein
MTMEDLYLLSASYLTEFLLIILRRCKYNSTSFFYEYLRIFIEYEVNFSYLGSESMKYENKSEI